MRLHRLTTGGVVPFNSPVTLDLDALGDNARLIAITGDNGSGKTTLLETWFRALRSTPTGVTLSSSLYTARDGFDEIEFSLDGRRLRCRQTVNGTAKNTTRDCSLVDVATGEPVLPTTSVRKFDEWAAEHLPDPAVFHTTIFAGQTREGHTAPNFLHLGPTDRKRLILDMLGCGRYEELAAKARARATAAESEITRLTGRLEALEDHVSIADYEADAATQKRVIEEARDDLAQARRDLTLAEQRHAQWAERHAEIETARARHETAKRKADEAKRRLEEAEAKVASAREVVATADEVRDRARRCEEAEEADREARGDLTDATRDYDRADSELKAVTRERESKRAMLDDARDRASAAGQRLAQVRRSIADLVAADSDPEDVAPLEAARDEARDRVAVAEGRVSELDGDRVGRLKVGLNRIKHTNELSDAHAIASRTLGANVDLEAYRASAQDLHAKARAELREAERLLADAVERKRAAETRAARLSEYRASEETALRDLDAANARVAEIQAEVEEAAKAVTFAQQLAIDHAANRSRVQARASEADAVVRSLADARRNLRDLERAEERLDALAPQLDSLRRDAEDAARELAQTPAPDDDTAPPDVEDERRAVGAAEKALEEAHAYATRAEAALERARDADAKRKDIARQIASQRVELSDWTRLAQDLGRDGLQAYEVDAAGPELSRIATDLLHEAYGPRWTVSIETTRIGSDGRELEDCFVSVVDNEAGVSGGTKLLSGGQQVIVGEAIRLALTVLACRLHGIESPTLVRDESGAALDAEAGERWLSMLRRAADLIGADRVLFVSHSPALWPLADVVVTVADGGLEVAA